MDELFYCAHQQNIFPKTRGLVSFIVKFLVVKNFTIGVGPQIFLLNTTSGRIVYLICAHGNVVCNIFK